MVKLCSAKDAVLKLHRGAITWLLQLQTLQDNVVDAACASSNQKQNNQIEPKHVSYRTDHFAYIHITYLFKIFAQSCKIADCTYWQDLPIKLGISLMQ